MESLAKEDLELTIRRRQFIRNAAIGTVGLTAFPELARALQTGQRTYTAGRFALELDGIHTGWLKRVEGGNTMRDVLTEKVDADLRQQKRLADARYGDITVTCGAGMSKPLYDWIKASFAGSHTRKNGSIITADYGSKEISRMDFHLA